MTSRSCAVLNWRALELEYTGRADPPNSREGRRSGAKL